MFLHISTKSSSIEQLLDQEDIEIELKLTDGDSSFHQVLGRSDIIKLKHKKNDQTDSEWATIFLQSLFNNLPLQSIDTVQLSGKEVNRNGSPVLELELKSILGNSISRVLGVLELKPLASEEVNFADQLFEWSRIMSDFNKTLYKESVKREAETESLKKEIQALKKFQTDLVEQSQKQEKLHLKIMTKLLNNKKDRYNKLVKGEIGEEDDDFNHLAIHGIKEEVFQEENDSEPKAKKPKKSPAKGVKRKRGIQKLRKLNQTKEYPQVKAEDEDQFIPDSQDEATPSIANEEKGEIEVKKESIDDKDDSRAAKAEPEKSIHFKFQDEQDKIELAEEKTSNDDEMIDATDEDTAADDTNDDDDEKIKGDDDEYENRTATETDTQSDTDTEEDKDD